VVLTDKVRTGSASAFALLRTLGGAPLQGLVDVITILNLAR